MLNFTAAETERDLNLVAAGQKPLCMILLGFHVMLLDADAELHFLDGYDALILAGFLFTLCLLEAELAVVHDLTHGGNRLGRDLNQIKTLFISDLLCVTSGLNTQLRTVGIDYSNLFISDLVVDLKFLVVADK